jgi:hypothetical protein
MARRRSSGLLETFIKSALGTGTTVHYKTDWLGRKQKVVWHLDTGKQKAYTHGCGFLGNITKTKTEKDGHLIEEGYLKKNFFGGTTEYAQKTDGTEIERKYSPGFFRDHVATQVNSQCFKCGGSGSKTLDCNICEGTGRFAGQCPNCRGRGKIHFDAPPCFLCQGTGKVRNSQCRKCNGNGQRKPATDEICKKCSGTGSHSAPCKKCDGRGNFTVPCGQCQGSGRYSKTEYK